MMFGALRSSCSHGSFNHGFFTELYFFLAPNQKQLQVLMEMEISIAGLKRFPYAAAVGLWN